MKKAKLALTAVAVFAVIGGALAFKASRQLHPFFTDKTFTTLVDGQVITSSYCTAPTNLSLIQQENGPLTTKASVSSTSVPCPVISVRRDA